MQIFIAFILALLSCNSAFAQSGPAVGAYKNPIEGQPLSAGYVLTTLDAKLPNGRTIRTGTFNNITVTDGGPAGQITWDLSGPVGIGAGGTGQTTRQAAINALANSAGSTSQDIFYFDGTNWTRLAKGANNTYLGTNGSGNLAWIAGTGGGIASSAEVILGATDASATNARILTQGTGITVTDSGTPNGAMTVAIDSTVATLTGTQTLTNKTLTAPKMAWNAGSGFVLRGSTFDSNILWADWGAARNITVPDPGATASFVLTEAAQTVNGTKTFSDLKLSSTTFKSGANTMTLPGASDNLVGEAATETLTNKTISAGSFDTNAKLNVAGKTYTVTWLTPTVNRAYALPDAGADAYFALTGQTITHAAGGVIYDDGAKMMCTTAGGSGQPLLSNGASAPTFGNLSAANGGTGQTTYTKGDLLVTPGGTTINKLAVAADGQVLTTDAASTNGVKWSAPTAGTLSLSGLSFMTSGSGTLTGSAAAGDLPYGSATNVWSKRTIGSTGQVLTVAGGLPTWADPPVSGFGGNGADGAITISGATGYTAPIQKNASTFTVNASQVLTCTGSPTIINATGAATVNGTITVAAGSGYKGGWCFGDGTRSGDGSGPGGGSGGGATFYYAYALGGGGGGFGARGGGPANIANAWEGGGQAYPCDLVGGSGGGGASYTTMGSMASGDGGGSLVMCAIGAISIPSGGAINAKGTSAVAATAGGGAGGGSGGMVFLASQTSISHATGSTIDVSGGAGAAGNNSNHGGGGAGGRLYRWTQGTVTSTGTFTATGGAAGGTNATAGGTGTATTIAGTPNLPLLTWTFDQGGLSEIEAIRTATVALREIKGENVNPHDVTIDGREVVRRAAKGDLAKFALYTNPQPIDQAVNTVLVIGDHVKGDDNAA